MTRINAFKLSHNIIQKVNHKQEKGWAAESRSDSERFSAGGGYFYLVIPAQAGIQEFAAQAGIQEV
ncbi:MAG: hypothetical protein LBS49_12180 [Candidatus Accumulibacter sp.]|jgi:hypothetical protein|nr:hypothetical protein [Accumulibacter sp.]